VPSPPPDAFPLSPTHEYSPQIPTDFENQNSTPPPHVQLQPSVFSVNDCVPPGTTTTRPSTSSVTSSIVWVRKDNYAFQRIENYIKDTVVRRLKYSKIENVQGIWTARVLEMADLKRNSRTILTFDKLEYNVPMKEENFTLQALRRGQ